MTPIPKDEALAERSERLFGRYPTVAKIRFKIFHEANPGVYRKFKELAFEMRATGRTKYSAETIVNVMRWHYDLETTGQVFEFNNDFKPLYARLLVFHHPEFEGFFEFREPSSQGIKSDEQRRREGEI